MSFKHRLTTALDTARSTWRLPESAHSCHELVCSLRGRRTACHCGPWTTKIELCRGSPTLHPTGKPSWLPPSGHMKVVRGPLEKTRMASLGESSPPPRTSTSQSHLRAHFYWSAARGLMLTPDVRPSSSSLRLSPERRDSEVDRMRRRCVCAKEGSPTRCPRRMPARS